METCCLDTACASYSLSFPSVTQNPSRPCAVLDSQPELFIHIAADKTNNTITLTDSGIGMTKVSSQTNVYGPHAAIPAVPNPKMAPVADTCVHTAAAVAVLFRLT